MTFRARDIVGRLRSSLGRPTAALAALLVFLFAVQLLGTATDAAAPVLERVFRRVVVGDATALGISWLATYVLTNGSVVAALSVSLFDAGVVSTGQLFVMVAGSRLGGSAIVVFVGGLDYLQRDRFRRGRYSLRSSVSMGVLTFLLTHSVFVPATVLGYVLLHRLRGPLLSPTREVDIGLHTLRFFEPMTVAVTNRIGPAPTFVLAVVLLFGSLQMFDRLLARVETATLRERLFGHFERTWLAFGLGVVLTAVTTSVAFSLGVVVPLYNRGYVQREELLPYVLGANIGTFADTLVVAVILESPVGLAVVLLLLVCASLLTLAALVALDRYHRLVSTVDDRLVADRRAFLAFLASLVIVPLVLLVVPLLVK